MGDGFVMKGELVADIGEDALIARLTAGLCLGDEVVVGAGDDCAVVEGLGSGWWQLLKTDAVVEGVHFLREAKPELVGWKAMARVVSDVGAMGGEPLQALVTLMVPRGCEVAYVEGLYVGLRRCAERFGVSVVGGETTVGPLVMLSVAMTGRVRSGCCVRRGGARVGDEILVTGRLGGSLGGHHLTFVPRVEEGRWLAESGLVHAMMDLSDGLAKDVPRMAALSGGLGWRVEGERLPLNEGCVVEDGMCDGEDYELLLAVPKGEVERLLELWGERFPQVLLSRIGSFVQGGEKKSLEYVGGGWDHFGGSVEQR